MEETTGENTVCLTLVSISCNYFLFLDGVRAKIYFRAQPHQVGNHVYLSVEEIKMDFSVQDIKMGISNVQNSNAVLGTFFFDPRFHTLSI